MQRVALGLQTPMQVPLAVLHTKGQGAPFTHLPPASHCCGVESLHCLESGVQEPAQAPAEQTAGHAAPLVHWPSAPQVCGICPLHFFSPGAQAPPHLAAAHTNAHACAGPHWPSLLHVSSAFAVVVEQRVALGVHAPVQFPDSQRTVHGVSSTQRPGVSHRCGVFSLHWRVPTSQAAPLSSGGRGESE